MTITTLEHLELTLVFVFFKWVNVHNYTYGILPVQSHIGMTAVCVLYFYNFELRRNISNTSIACWSLSVRLMIVILILCVLLLNVIVCVIIIEYVCGFL
jgi:hypothetical protein